MKRFLQFGSITLICSLLFSCSPAQAGSEKYAFIDVAKIFDEYQKTKENDQVLQKALETKETERNVIVQDLRKIKEEMELLSEEAKKTRQAEIDKKVGELQEFDAGIRKELGDQKRVMIQEIFNDIDAVVQEYGKKNNFDFILNEKAVLYHRAALNVTEDVLKELNKNYSAKAKK